MPTHFSDLADPAQDTHLLDLASTMLNRPFVTMTEMGYTAEGVRAEFRYSLDHKDYVVEVREKK
jgi:hypothetical protein